MLHSVTNANVRWTVWQMQMHIWLFYVTNVIASARKFPLSDKCKFKYMSTFQRSHHSPPKGSGPRQIGPRNTNTNANANANTFQRSNHSPPKQVTDIVNETCWAVCYMLSYKLVCVYKCVPLIGSNRDCDSTLRLGQLFHHHCSPVHIYHLVTNKNPQNPCTECVCQS